MQKQFSQKNKFKFVIVGVLLLLPFSAHAAQEVIQKNIENTQEQLKAVTETINKLQGELTKTQTQTASLQTTVKEIDLTRQKIGAEISLTTKKLETTAQKITRLIGEIEAHERSILVNTEAVRESLVEIHNERSLSLVELFLSERTLSDLMRSIESNERVQTRLTEATRDLNSAREKLVLEKASLEQNKKSLATLTSELSDRKKLADQNRNEKNKLLTATKSQESTYQQMLTEQIRLKEQFEADLKTFEAQLKITLDEGKLPETGKGTLSWPIADPLITQQFGVTSFSLANPRVYNGKGHNGIDLRATVGSQISSAAPGVVRGTGNTDLFCPGGSYGQWVLVEHPNGLSTLYAHLSLTKVKKGDEVTRGGLLGYSGNTGYSTGPHLHFTVYATQAVQITQLVRADGSVSRCGVMPVAATDGYLNPLQYLP